MALGPDPLLGSLSDFGRTMRGMSQDLLERRRLDLLGQGQTAELERQRELAGLQRVTQEQAGEVGLLRTRGELAEVESRRQMREAENLRQEAAAGRAAELHGPTLSMLRTQGQYAGPQAEATLAATKAQQQAAASQRAAAEVQRQLLSLQVGQETRKQAFRQVPIPAHEFSAFLDARGPIFGDMLRAVLPDPSRVTHESLDWAIGSINALDPDVVTKWNVIGLDQKLKDPTLAPNDPRRAQYQEDFQREMAILGRKGEKPDPKATADAMINVISARLSTLDPTSAAYAQGQKQLEIWANSKAAMEAKNMRERNPQVYSDLEDGKLKIFLETQYPSALLPGIGEEGKHDVAQTLKLVPKTPRPDGQPGEVYDTQNEFAGYLVRYFKPENITSQDIADYTAQGGTTPNNLLEVFKKTQLPKMTKDAYQKYDGSLNKMIVGMSKGPTPLAEGLPLTPEQIQAAEGAARLRTLGVKNPTPEQSAAEGAQMPSTLGEELMGGLRAIGRGIEAGEQALERFTGGVRLGTRGPQATILLRANLPVTEDTLTSLAKKLNEGMTTQQAVTAIREELQLSGPTPGLLERLKRPSGPAMGRSPGPPMGSERLQQFRQEQGR